LGHDFVEIAADGTEIRPLASNEYATVVHCTLGGGEVDVPTYNVGIDEIWYFVSGEGEFWGRAGSGPDSEPVKVKTGTAVTIPPHVEFQIRSTSPEPLSFICITTPPWPGIQANIVIEKGKWPQTVPPGPHGPVAGSIGRQ
jgi:mannose-6-phosphate isomerase-like protein (cupin superfamily)